MSRLRRGSLITLLQRELDLTYDQAADVVRTLNISTDPTNLDPEDYAIVGQRLAWGGHKALAAAALNSAVGLRNKQAFGGNSIIIGVETIITSEVGVGVLQLRGGGALFGTALGFFRDLSIGGGAGSDGGGVMAAGQIVFDNTQLAAAYGGFTISDGISLAPGAPLTLLSPFVLGPSQQIFFVHPTVNSGLAGHFAWREYELAKGL